MLMNANGGDAKVRTKLHSMETLTIMKKTPILTLLQCILHKTSPHSDPTGWTTPFTIVVSNGMQYIINVGWGGIIGSPY